MYVEKKKKSSVVIVIFLILLLGIGIYFGVNYYLQEKAKKTNKKPPKVEEKVTVPLTENEQFLFMMECFLMIVLMRQR